MANYESRNPSTGELIQRFEEATDAEIEKALDGAQKAYREWRKLSFEERKKPLLKVAELLENRAEELAKLMAEEMGKPLSEGIAEAKKSAWVCRHYAEKAESLLADVAHVSDGSEAYVRYDPIGPILAIMPWNFPFWQVFRFIGPTLIAGNTGILKHAPNTPRCALAIADLMTEAGYPSHVFQTLFLSNEQAAKVIADSRIAGVTLTGSTRAGRAVAQEGGRALKPMVMELGGSDPFIIFEDADLEQAVQHGFTSRFLNNGQSCIAAKRFIVHKNIEEKFTQALLDKVKKAHVGDPLKEEGVTIGPMARLDLREQLHDQVTRSLAQGATLLHGGQPLERDGFFYAPTIIKNVQVDNPAAQEELFGPVAVIMTFETEEEAVSIANNTEYGLGSSIWTKDEERIKRLIPQIDAGNVFVNGMVKSDPRLPFGGAKSSGFGRELGREGILAFVNTKTVWIA